jgi:hypothetical protein
VNGSEGIKLLASDYEWFTEGSMPAMLGLQRHCWRSRNDRVPRRVFQQMIMLFPFGSIEQACGFCYLTYYAEKARVKPAISYTLLVAETAH